MTKRKEPKWLQAARAGASGEKTYLERALGRAGVFKDGLVHRAIMSSRVTVDGVLAKDPMTPVGPDSRVAIDLDPVALRWSTQVLMLHKPEGLIVASSDAEGDGTVFEALRDRLDEAQRKFVWHACGRLDRETTGLLLFTNDPGFVEHATRPASLLEKHYFARVIGDLDAALPLLAAGVTLTDGVAKPTKVEKREDNALAISVAEGRHHLVRRMLDAVRLSVKSLHREGIGGLSLDVHPGAVRSVTPDEIREKLRYTPKIDTF